MGQDVMCGMQGYIRTQARSLKCRDRFWRSGAGVLNIGGVSFNVKEKFNTEVMLLASSSDTTLKMALLTIPKDKQRRWEEGHGGVQHPTDDTFALDFSDSLAHLTKNKFAVQRKIQIKAVRSISGPAGLLWSGSVLSISLFELPM